MKGCAAALRQREAAESRGIAPLNTPQSTPPASVTFCAAILCVRPPLSQSTTKVTCNL